MSQDVQHDQFVLIKIEGMHCHKCEQSIKRTLQREPGVHEVEVDFASGQASVLYDSKQITVRRLMEVVGETGYKTTGHTQGRTDTAGRTDRASA